MDSMSGALSSDRAASCVSPRIIGTGRLLVLLALFFVQVRRRRASSAAAASPTLAWRHVLAKCGSSRIDCSATNADSPVYKV